ncbi:MAG: hypothetical protein V3U98_11810 [Acidobacteriota bacterium]
MIKPNTAAGTLLSAGRNRAKARVYALDWEGHRAVLKSVSHQVRWLRWLAGRRQLDREERAYRRLAGVPGIPALVARPDPDSLVCERVEGRRLDDYPRRSLPGAVFDRLAQVLEQAHARGVAHGDLHRKDVVVDAAGAPWLLDWATSLVRAGGRGWAREALFRRWVEFDRRAVEKLRRRYSAAAGPGPLPPRWAPHRWLWRLRHLGRSAASRPRGRHTHSRRAMAPGRK